MLAILFDNIAKEKCKKKLVNIDFKYRLVLVPTSTTSTRTYLLVLVNID